MLLGKWWLRKSWISRRKRANFFVNNSLNESYGWDGHLGIKCVSKFIVLSPFGHCTICIHKIRIYSSCWNYWSTDWRKCSGTTIHATPTKYLILNNHCHFQFSTLEFRWGRSVQRYKVPTCCVMKIAHYCRIAASLWWIQFFLSFAKKLTNTFVWRFRIYGGAHEESCWLGTLLIRFSNSFRAVVDGSSGARGVNVLMLNLWASTDEFSWRVLYPSVVFVIHPGGCTLVEKIRSLKVKQSPFFFLL